VHFLLQRIEGATRHEDIERRRNAGKFLPQLGDEFFGATG